MKWHEPQVLLSSLRGRMCARFSLTRKRLIYEQPTCSDVYCYYVKKNNNKKVCVWQDDLRLLKLCSLKGKVTAWAVSAVKEPVAGLKVWVSQSVCECEKHSKELKSWQSFPVQHQNHEISYHTFHNPESSQTMLFFLLSFFVRFFFYRSSAFWKITWFLMPERD